MWLRRLSVFCFVVLMGVVCYGSQTVSGVQTLIDEGKYEEAKSLCYEVLENPDLSDDHVYYYSKLGDVYYYLGDLRESLRYYLIALEQPGINHPENRKIKEETTSYAGFGFRELGLDQKAELYFRSALDQAIHLGDSAEIAVCYYNVSTALLAQGQLDESMEMLQHAYEIDVARKDTAAIGFDLTMMGAAMIKTGQPQKAIKYYQQSVDFLSLSSGNYDSYGKRYGLLAEAYLAYGHHDSAIYYINKSIEVYQQGSDSVKLAVQWVKLAEVLNDSEKPDEGLSWAAKATDLLENYPLSSVHVFANRAMIESYRLTGKSRQALTLATKNQTLIQQLGLLHEMRDSYLNKSALLREIGRYSEALDVLEQSYVLIDSINQLETKRAAEAMRVRYDAEKVESENELLRMENEVTKANLAERQAEVRNLFLGGLIVLLLIGGALIIVLVRSRMKTKVLQAEVNELRTRIKGILEFKPEDAGVVKEQINNSLQETLTDREFEILNLALSNKNNSEIADEIHLSVNTVKYHLKNIYSKLGVSNRKEALKYAVQITY